jgi:hypothetical protein
MAIGLIPRPLLLLLLLLLLTEAAVVLVAVMPPPRWGNVFMIDWIRRGKKPRGR